MERNDIAPWSTSGLATLFEGVLASPPSKGQASVRNWYHRRSGDWDDALKLWRPHELPLKSLIDTVNRKGIQTTVYTLLGYAASEAIESWLARKGVSVQCVGYPDAELLAEDLTYNRTILTVYVPTKELAYLIGPRATVVTPSTAWVL
jgi:hypothetical protein